MGETRKALRVIYVSGKWFGIFPIYETKNKSTFYWRSLRTAYFLLLLLITICQWGHDVYIKRATYGKQKFIKSS